jgi:hypothetical protein
VIRGCLYPVGEKVEGDEMKVEDKTAKADSRLGSEEKNDVDLQREDEDMDDAPPTENGQ